jgi:hypothetical protein
VTAQYKEGLPACRAGQPARSGGCLCRHLSYRAGIMDCRVSGLKWIELN